MERDLLTVSAIENITKKCVSKEILYNIKQSESTNTVYLKLKYYDGIQTTIRFSDHKTKRTKVKTVIVSKNTTVDLIERTIVKSCNDLKRLYLFAILGLTKLKQDKIKIK